MGELNNGGGGWFDRENGEGGFVGALGRIRIHRDQAHEQATADVYFFALDRSTLAN